MIVLFNKSMLSEKWLNLLAVNSFLWVLAPNVKSTTLTNKNIRIIWKDFIKLCITTCSLWLVRTASQSIRSSLLPMDPIWKACFENFRRIVWISNFTKGLVTAGYFRFFCAIFNLVCWLFLRKLTNSAGCWCTSWHSICVYLLSWVCAKVRCFNYSTSPIAKNCSTTVLKTIFHFSQWEAHRWKYAL